MADLGAPLSINAPVVWVLGGPGSGKGTQCAKIVEKYGYVHISSGDLLREEVAKASPLGQQLSEIMKKGELVPLETVLQLLKNAIASKAESAKGFLIDGYPRTVEQGEKFTSLVCPVKAIVFFDLSDDLMAARLLERGKSSGRADDNEETIRKRLQTFRNESMPVVDKYREMVQTIPATDPVDVVFGKVVTFMDKLQ
ncbi:adenylate kinase isoenzyme 1-like [Tropilaelaps mercedesae]|uniref:adenylate kinase n=1 Tax=Tropilaelaps mercedesae TaxID=418985 RepID=A0A1V9XCA4_9ACAR|nr:adenylate kinase isoenzyme 1-like [Tropilaelaps mercedesae]